MEQTAHNSRQADHCWKLLLQAEQRGDARARRHFLALLERLDDGRYADLIEGTGTLELETDPPGAQVRLYPVPDPPGAVDPGSGQPLGASPLGPMDLAPGSYLLQIQADGSDPVWRPFVLPRGSDLRLSVRLFAPHQLGAGFVQVSAGTFGPRSDTVVGNFAISQDPLAAGQVQGFLDALADRDPELAIRLTPPKGVRPGLDGLSGEAVRAYCDWTFEQTGVRLRPPTVAERNKARLLLARIPSATSARVDKKLNYYLVRQLPPGGGQRVTPPVVPSLLEEAA
jgi:hypothetical protein